MVPEGGQSLLDLPPLSNLEVEPLEGVISVPSQESVKPLSVYITKIY